MNPCGPLRNSHSPIPNSVCAWHNYGVHDHDYHCAGVPCHDAWSRLPCRHRWRMCLGISWCRDEHACGRLANLMYQLARCSWHVYFGQGFDSHIHWLRPKVPGVIFMGVLPCLDLWLPSRHRWQMWFAVSRRRVRFGWVAEQTGCSDGYYELNMFAVFLKLVYMDSCRCADA